MKKSLYTLCTLLIFFGIINMFSFSSRSGADADNANSGNTIFNKYNVYSFSIPENLTFAEEKVPVHLFDVRERFDRELLVNSYWQSQTLLLFKRAHRWFPVIEPILKKRGIPDDFKYLAVAESGLTNVVSPAGATGYWQFLTAAGKQYGLEISNEVDERYHVEKSTEAACKYLQDAYNKSGSWALAAASYNMGMEGIRKQMERQRVTSYYDLQLNDETSRYVFRLLALKEIFGNPKKYGFLVNRRDLYPVIPTVTMEVDSSIGNMIDFAEKQGVNYKILRILNPWLRQQNLTNKERKKYIIRLPNPSFNYLEAMENEADELIEHFN